MIKQITIEDNYVSVDTAIDMKTHGFIGSCHKFQNTDTISFGKEWNASSTITIPIPTFEMAMKWLRVVYNIHIEVRYNKGNDNYSYHIIKGTSQMNDINNLTNYDSYEQACEEAIKECMNHIISQ